MLSTYHALTLNNQTPISPSFPMHSLQTNHTGHANPLLLTHAEQNLRLGQQQFQGKKLGLSAYNGNHVRKNKIKPLSRPNKPFARSHRTGRAAIIPDPESNHGLSFPHYHALALLSKTQKPTELDKPLVRTHRDKRAPNYILNPENTPLPKRQPHSPPVKTPVLKEKSYPHITGIGFMSVPKLSHFPPRESISYLSPPLEPTAPPATPSEEAVKQGTLCERLIACGNLFKKIFFKLLPQSLHFPRAELHLYNTECKPIRTEANIAQCLKLEPRSIKG